jgi:hypothetical protein
MTSHEVVSLPASCPIRFNKLNVRGHMLNVTILQLATP